MSWSWLLLLRLQKVTSIIQKRRARIFGRTLAHHQRRLRARQRGAEAINFLARVGQFGRNLQIVLENSFPLRLGALFGGKS